jgi:hypothetical protein
VLHAFVSCRPWPDSLHDDAFPGLRDLVDHTVSILMEARSPDLGVGSQFDGRDQHRIFRQILKKLYRGLPRSIFELAKVSPGGWL